MRAWRYARPLSTRTSADFLRVIPLFSGLTRELRAEVAARAQTVHAEAGDWLFRQGDAGDALYVVRTGRLEIVSETAEPTVVGVAGRGDAIGELALLTGAPRAASVRAVRDTEMLRISAADFAELLAGDPDFALAMTRMLGQRLVERGAQPFPQSVRARTIALVGATEGVPTAALAGTLVAALERHGTATGLRSAAAPDPAAYGALLDRCERSHDQVVLEVSNPVVDDAWMRFAVRQADRVMLVADADEPPPAWLAEHPRLRGCDLLFCGHRPDPAAAAPWHDAVAPTRQHVVGTAGEAAVGLQRIARRLTGRSVGVVLSGGRARGLAHIGVLRGLLDAEVEIDRIGGSDTGALVAALFASGRTPEEMAELCRTELVRGHPFEDYAESRVSLTAGRKVAEMLDRIFGTATIEGMPRELFCVAADLASGEEVVERHGLAADVVARSMALPGLSPPAATNGRLLVDGGVLDNLPVGPMADTREGPVIAVDVVGGRALDLGAGPPDLVEILARATVVGSWRAAESARARADLVIAPELGDVRLNDFDAIDELVAAGTRAAEAALETARDRLVAVDQR